MSREITYAEAVREAMAQAMDADDRVFLMGEDIGVYGGAFGVTNGMIDRFGPSRIRDTPISENGTVGVGVGAALLGMRPVIEMQFSDFVANAMDPLVNQAAKIHFMFGGQLCVPLVVRLPAGGGTGAAAQHSQSQEAWFVHVPGLKVAMPATPADAKGLLLAAIADDNPVGFVEHKLLYRVRGDVPEAAEPLPFGQGVVRRQGRDVTVVATSLMVHKALEAAERLQEQGTSVEVFDPRTLVPLDAAGITASVMKTGRLVVVHEAVERGGFGAEIAAVVSGGEAFSYLQAPIRRVAARNTPIPYSPGLEAAVIPSVDDIVAAVAATVSGG